MPAGKLREVRRAFSRFQREFGMRRLALSVFTACGLALLTACSGGTAFSVGGNGNNPTFVAFTNNSSAETQDFFVSPTSAPAGSGFPLSITAFAERTGTAGTALVLP